MKISQAALGRRLKKTTIPSASTPPQKQMRFKGGARLDTSQIEDKRPKPFVPGKRQEWETPEVSHAEGRRGYRVADDYSADDTPANETDIAGDTARRPVGLKQGGGRSGGKSGGGKPSRTVLQRRLMRLGKGKR